MDEYWPDTPPARCTICLRDLEADFVRGPILQGPWHSMCLRCHGIHGRGFGPVRGQHYVRQQDNRWKKVAG